MEKQQIKELVSFLGGTENVVQFTHCMTRLRFEVSDASLIDVEAIKKLEVLGAHASGKQCQVIIGGKVDKVFKEINARYPELTNTQTSIIEASKSSQNILQRILESLSAILVDTLPPIIGCGIIQGIRFTLMSFNYPSDSNLMFMLALMGSCALYFFPFLLACSTAKRVKLNQYIAMGIAAAMMYPTIINQVGSDPMKFFGFIEMPFINYSSSVIPIIVAVWLAKYVYNFFDRIVPSVVKVIFVPVLTYLVMMPVTLVAIAPIMTYGGNYLAIAIEWLFVTVPWFAGAFIGGTRPLLVLIGMHHAVRPLQAQQIATYNYTTITPINYISTMCQATAALATVFITKQKENRQVAISSAISGFMGVTEPALYGVIFKYKGALIGTVAGGAIGGLLSSMMSAKAYTFGVPNTIFTAPVFMGESAMSLLVGLFFGMLTTAFITIILGKTIYKVEDDIKFTDGKLEKEMVKKTGKLSKISFTNVGVPVSGTIVPLEELNDNTFSKKTIGEGISILPNDKKIFAPIDGVVETVFHTKHAIGITADNGVKILIHAGIDTVKLDGKFFTTHVKQGQSVKRGDLLLEMDYESIAKQGYDIHVVVLVIDNIEQRKVKIARKNGTVKVLDTLLNIEEI